MQLTKLYSFSHQMNSSKHSRLSALDEGIARYVQWEKTQEENAKSKTQTSSRFSPLEKTHEISDYWSVNVCSDPEKSKHKISYQKRSHTQLPDMFYDPIWLFNQYNERRQAEIARVHASIQNLRNQNNLIFMGGYTSPAVQQHKEQQMFLQKQEQDALQAIKAKYNDSAESKESFRNILIKEWEARRKNPYL